MTHPIAYQVLCEVLSTNHDICEHCCSAMEAIQTSTLDVAKKVMNAVAPQALAIDLTKYRPSHEADAPFWTTNTGAPVWDNDHSLTVGARGPVLLEDYHLLEKLAQFHRERIPERVVHARGASAKGYFEVGWAMIPGIRSTSSNNICRTLSSVNPPVQFEPPARTVASHACRSQCVRGHWPLKPNRLECLLPPQPLTVGFGPCECPNQTRDTILP